MRSHHDPRWVPLRLPRAHEQGVEASSVVVAALRAAMWRHEGERKREALSRVGGDPCPELPAASADEVAVVWRDLDG